MSRDSSRNDGTETQRSESARSEISVPTGLDEDEAEALVKITHGAVVTSGAVSGQRVLMTATEYVLALGLGPVAYGVYALGWRITQLLSGLVPFGSVPAIQRFLPAATDSERKSRVVGLAYATTIGFGVAFAITLWLLAPGLNDLTLTEESFPPTMRRFGLLVGLMGIVMIIAAIFRAIGSARGEVLFNKLLRPAVRLVAASVALSVGYSVVGVAGALVVGMGVLVLVGVPVSIRVTGIVPRLRGVRGEVREFYNHAAPVAMSAIGKIFQNRIDILLVGALLTAVAAGVYNVVLVFVALAWIPLASFNQLLPPVASDLYADDRMETLNTVYSSVTRLIVTTVLPLLAVLGVYGREFLLVFGSTYTRGYVPLVIYLGGTFVGSAVGATGWLLMMTDHQYARMVLDWFLAALNIVLTYTFVVTFGLAGAALGTSVAISVQNGMQVLLLKRFEGLFPFDRTFAKPIAAGGIMIAVMLVVRTALAGFLAVGVGILFGMGSYLLSLLALGVDPRDRLVVRELRDSYRRTIVDIVA